MDISNNLILALILLICLLIVFVLVILIKKELWEEIRKERGNRLKDQSELNNQFSIGINNIDKKIEEYKLELAELKDNLKGAQKKSFIDNQLVETVTPHSPRMNPVFESSMSFKDFLGKKFPLKNMEIMTAFRNLKNPIFSDDKVIGDLQEVSGMLDLSSAKSEFIKQLKDYTDDFFFGTDTKLILPLIGDSFDKELMDVAKVVGGNNKVQAVLFLGMQKSKKIIKKAMVNVH